MEKRTDWNVKKVGAPQKIESVHVKYIKGVEEIQIFADPDLNELSGKVGQGKTSVLDAIVMALGGLREKAGIPVMVGKEEGVIEVDTTDYQVVRTFTKGGDSKLTVRGKKGGKFGQADLSRLLTGLTFDPTVFVSWSAEEQTKAIQKLAGEEWVDKLQTLEAQIAVTYQERADVNRQIKAVGNLVEPPAVEEVSTEDLLRERDRIVNFNRAQELRRIRIDESRDNIRRIQGLEVSAMGRFKAAQDALARAEEELNVLHAKLETAEVERKELIDPEPARDTAEVDRKLADVARANAQVVQRKIWEQKAADLEAMKERSKELGDKLEGARRAKARHAESIELPMPGLSLDTEKGLMVGPVPFRQSSTGEQIRLSALIGMALEPELKVMMIQRGESLDDEAFGELCEIAKERGYQLWVATVGSGHSKASIVIEAGKIKE